MNTNNKGYITFALSKAVEYIEENLKGDIDINECANLSGYSLYYFMRIFKEATGLTPADYIRKRRLSEIAKSISEDEDFTVKLAFDYGFNSHANFIRAFKAEHHILPSEYKKVKNSLRLYEPIKFKVQPFVVIPQIVTLEGFSLTLYKSDQKTPPSFWNKYNAKKMSLKLSGGRCVYDYA